MCVDFEVGYSAWNIPGIQLQTTIVPRYNAGTTIAHIPRIEYIPLLITHTFGNHTHRAGVPRLERGSNHGELTPLTLASRCGNVGPLLPPRGVYEAPVP